MTGKKIRMISSLLIIILLANFMGTGLFLANYSRVEAGFWNDHQDNIFTVLKGLAMLWIINLISQGDDDVSEEEDLLTSIIDNDLPPAEVEIIPTDEAENKEDEILTEKEQEMFNKINQFREEEGVPVLTIKPELVEIARIKAKDMIENNYFEHYSPTYGSPFEMMQARDINYLLAGENLAGATTVDKALELLMESPEHKENILDLRYDKIGIGIIEGGPYGLMVVQHFINSSR